MIFRVNKEEHYRSHRLAQVETVNHSFRHLLCKGIVGFYGRRNGVFTNVSAFFCLELTCLEVLAYQQTGAADQ